MTSAAAGSLDHCWTRVQSCGPSVCTKFPCQEMAVLVRFWSKYPVTPSNRGSISGLFNTQDACDFFIFTKLKLHSFSKRSVFILPLPVDSMFFLVPCILPAPTDSDESRIWLLHRECRALFVNAVHSSKERQTRMLNNRVRAIILRLPAIVLLNTRTTFRPRNSGLLRVRPEFPGRNVVFNKTIAGRRRTLLLECKASENVCEKRMLKFQNKQMERRVKTTAFTCTKRKWRARWWKAPCFCFPRIEIVRERENIKKQTQKLDKKVEKPEKQCES